MHAAGFGMNPPHQQFGGPQYPAPGVNVGMAQAHDPAAGAPGMTDPAQLQQLVQLLGAKMLPKQTAVVECPKSMVGRVIGKGGETIKSLQQYTGAMIQIDQSTDPTRVTIAGAPQSLQLAVSMVNDIVRGTFKGFAMLRQIALSTSQPGMPGFGQPQPVYVQGYGFVPPSQVYNPDDPLAAAQMLRSSPPTGPLTPPMTPLRAAATGNLPGGLTPEALAALLGQQQQAQGMPMGGMPGMGGPGGSQDALLSQLQMLMSGQQVQQAAPTMNLQQHHAAMQQMQQGPSDAMQGGGGAGPDPAIQALLAQAGLLAGGQMGALMMSNAGAPAGLSGPGSERSYGRAPMAGPLSAASVGSGGASPAPSVSVPVPAPASTLGGLPQGAAPGSYLGTSPTPTHSSAGSGRASPAVGLAAANPALTTRRPGSDTGSPLGRYGAVGSPSSQGAASSIGAAAEEALAARLAAAGISSAHGGTGLPASTSSASHVSVVSSADNAVLPPGWAKVSDGQGLVYYVNHITQESSLTRPSAQGQAAM